MKSYTCRKCS